MMYGSGPARPWAGPGSWARSSSLRSWSGNAGAQPAAIAAAGVLLSHPVPLDILDDLGRLRSEERGQGLDRQLATGLRRQRGDRPRVGTLEEAKHYAAGPVQRRVVERDAELVVETDREPAQAIPPPERRLVGDLDLDDAPHRHLLGQRVAR